MLVMAGRWPLRNRPRRRFNDGVGVMTPNPPFSCVSGCCAASRVALKHTKSDKAEAHKTCPYVRIELEVQAMVFLTPEHPVELRLLDNPKRKSSISEHGRCDIASFALF